MHAAGAAGPSARACAVSSPAAPGVFVLGRSRTSSAISACTLLVVMMASGFTMTRCKGSAETSYTYPQHHEGPIVHALPTGEASTTLPGGQRTCTLRTS